MRIKNVNHTFNNEPQKKLMRGKFQGEILSLLLNNHFLKLHFLGGLNLCSIYTFIQLYFALAK